MKKATTAIMIMAITSLTAMSCADSQKGDSKDTTLSERSTSDDTETASSIQNEGAKQVLADYMSLKDALVDTDEKAAANAGKKLENTLENFKSDSYNSEDQKELKDIVESATEHAEHISRSDIAHQREHFLMLTKDITDMVAITGSENTLYEQFCPMYEDDVGAWLSMKKEIRNPYFGDKMLKCGEVQREIN